MAAPAKPEAASSPGTPGTKVPSAEELASRPTPPTNQPPNPPTDPPRAGESVDTTAHPVDNTVELDRQRRIVAAQDAALRDQQRQIAELTQRTRGIDERVTRAEKGPEPSPDDLNEQFWKNPSGVMGTLIQKELATTVAPINERLNKLSQGQNLSAYDQMKAKVKAEYSDIWERIEPAIDEWARGSQAGGQEVTEQMLSIAALTASGAYYRGQLPGMEGRPPAPTAPPNPAPPAPPTSGAPPVPAPPHLRPSAPPAPGHEQPTKKESRDLTENEARLARERGQSKEEFLAWLDVPPEQVVHSKIGRKEPPKP